MTDHQDTAPDHPRPTPAAATRAAFGLQIIADRAVTRADPDSGARIFTTGCIRTAADQAAHAYRQSRYADACHYLDAMSAAMDQLGVPHDTADRRTLAAFRLTLTDQPTPDTETTP